MQVEPSIRIRAARLQDVDIIASFSAAMALETEGRRLDLDRLKSGTRALFNTPTFGGFQVAEPSDAPGSIVAQLMITYEWSDWRNGVFWWIQSVYVAPAWRRQGVFRRMHEAVLADARSRPDVCGVRLYVEETNRIAQAVYQRVGLRPSSYTVYENDFVFPIRTPLQDCPDEA